MNGMYFDPDGQPLEMLEWAQMLESIERRVAVTTFADGMYVSTVWLGLNQQFFLDDDIPLIYESMVFAGDFPNEDYDMQRYANKVDAWKGHQQLVALVSIQHGEPYQEFVGPLGAAAQQEQV
jgi:hypothetical protein